MKPLHWLLLVCVGLLLALGVFYFVNLLVPQCVSEQKASDIAVKTEEYRAFAIAYPNSTFMFIETPASGLCFADFESANATLSFRFFGSNITDVTLGCKNDVSFTGAQALEGIRNNNCG